jgi:hypothetical protein
MDRKVTDLLQLKISKLGYGQIDTEEPKYYISHPLLALNVRDFKKL